MRLSPGLWGPGYRPSVILNTRWPMLPLMHGHHAVAQAAPAQFIADQTLTWARAGQVPNAGGR